MVNNSEHPKHRLPPYKNGEPTEINNGGAPLYPLDQVKQIAVAAAIRLVTDKCINDLANKLTWDNDHVAHLFNQLTSANYYKSEWCRTNANMYLPCDAYVLNRMEYIYAAQKQLNCEYYVKFAVSTNGQLLLIVSCHMSEFR